MMKQHALYALAMAASMLAPAGCLSSGNSIRRVHPNETIDLSGTWNDVDANEVAAVMIQDCLTHPWSASFIAQQGRNPVVRLYPVRNRTSEHIEIKYFTKQVEQELVNSARVEVVGDLVEAGDVRLERADQAQHASVDTMKPDHNEIGSDYVLNGWIVEEHDQTGGREVKAYVITMELIHTERNHKIWMKTHRIKKDILRADAGW